MTHEIRVLVESAMFWRDLAEQWRKRGNQDAVDNCKRHEQDRWTQIDWLLSQKGEN